MCNCTCGWRFFTDYQASFVCPQCGESVECDGWSTPIEQATPVAQWPRWALLIKRLHTDADKGVGDTAQRIAAKFGGERYKRLAKRLGMPCGCSERQDEWNRLYPYD